MQMRQEGLVYSRTPHMYILPDKEEHRPTRITTPDIPNNNKTPVRSDPHRRRWVKRIPAKMPRGSPMWFCFSKASGYRNLWEVATSRFVMVKKNPPRVSRTNLEGFPGKVKKKWNFVRNTVITLTGHCALHVHKSLEVWPLCTGHVWSASHISLKL